MARKHQAAFPLFATHAADTRMNNGPTMTEERAHERATRSLVSASAANAGMSTPISANPVCSNQ